MDIIEKTGRGLRELALFAGAGGGILGGKMLGWRTVCAVEIEPYCQSILCQRQNEGILETFPIWDDVCTFDGTAWKGYVDVISGGFPCQDISAANSKGAGINGVRSGLWSQMQRIVSEVQPQWVFVENSPMLIHRGLGRVLGDLASMGYDAEYGILGADDVGACHERERMWILAGKVPDTRSARCEQQGCNKGEQLQEGQSNAGNDGDVLSNASVSFVEGGRLQRGYAEEHFRTTISGKIVPESEGTEPRREVYSNSGGKDVESWQDWKGIFLSNTSNGRNEGGAHSWQKLKKLRDLGYITPEEMSAMASVTGGKLNPTWVEWLMGWPLGWTDLKPLEMVKYQR